MDLSISDCFHFLIASIILNPVLFLHSLNALLTCTLPCLEGYDWSNTYVQPHLDLHKDERLCWVYSAFIVFVQLIAFRRFDLSREDRDNENQDSAMRSQEDETSFGKTKTKPKRNRLPARATYCRWSGLSENNLLVEAAKDNSPAPTIHKNLLVSFSEKFATSDC